MDISDYLYQFCDFCLSFAKMLWSQKQNMQTIFTNTPGEEIFLIGKCSEVFQGPVVQSLRREEISWKTFKLPNRHTAIMFPWYFQLQPEDEILYKCQLFLEVNGCNRL